MRISLLATIATTALLSAGAAAAQDTAAAPAQSGRVDFGLRGTFFGDNPDEARYQRYRDLRSGPFVDAFRFTKQTDQWQLNVRGNKVGYRDQEFRGDLARPGKLQVSFSWTQIPLFFSRETQTPFTSASQGDLVLSDAVQAGVQNRTLTSAAYVPLASAFDLRLRRDIADVRVKYTATRDLDLNFFVRHVSKDGEQQWGGTFGFGNAVELPAPVDHHTTDVGAAAEWNNQRAMVRLGYDGSFFRNSVKTLTWDNPLIAVDTATAGSSRGRMTLWPNSGVNAANLMGSLALPARSRATAYVSLGRWSQNQELIPFTINSALPPIPLDRPTADARANVTAMNYTFNTRPTDMLWFSARFRQYKFDNRTPEFHVGQTVTFDQNVTTHPIGHTEPFGSDRKSFDVEGSVTPWTFAAFRLGYTREDIDRTFRVFETTDEDIVRASVDTTPFAGLTVRAVYEHGNRKGVGLDEEALDTIGEQVSLRQFDISDRMSDRFSTIVQAIPFPSLAFNATASIGREDRQKSQFGLRSNDNHALGAGVDLVPRDAVSIGLSYQFETFDALQRSRQANPGPQFNDPTRDWATDSDDTVHTVSLSADFIKLWPKTDLRIAFDASRGKSTYVYEVAANSTLQRPVQLPSVINRFYRGTADVQYQLARHFAAGLAYWYDRYDVNDYALNPATLNTVAEPAFLALRYVFKPYTANTAWVRLTYLW